jgi:hypothetical protein
MDDQSAHWARVSGLATRSRAQIYHSTPRHGRTSASRDWPATAAHWTSAAARPQAWLRSLSLACLRVAGGRLLRPVVRTGATCSRSCSGSRACRTTDADRPAHPRSSARRCTGVRRRLLRRHSRRLQRCSRRRSARDRTASHRGERAGP